MLFFVAYYLKKYAYKIKIMTFHIKPENNKRIAVKVYFLVLIIKEEGDCN